LKLHAVDVIADLCRTVSHPLVETMRMACSRAAARWAG
jgi:hypothetical protein